MQLFYVRPHVPVNIIRVFLNFRFSSRKSQHQQKIAKKITYSIVQFLSKNVTNNKLNMGPFKKYVTCITAFLLHSILSHFVNFFLSVPLRYLLNFTKKLKNERKDDFLHIMYLLQCIALCQRKQKITFLEAIAFLDRHVSTNNPHWQSSGVIMFLHKYDIVIYFRYTGMLFLGCALFVALCNIIRASWEIKKEKLTYRKMYIEEFVWGISLFWLNALLFISFFVAFFV